MGVEEELKEQLEKAHDSFEKQVAGTMAILAAALAVVTVLGHSSATEEVVNQAKASDQWAYYQAKSIRRYESEIARDILAPQADKAAAYQKSMERYEKEGADIQKEAQGPRKRKPLRGPKSRALRIRRSVLRDIDRAGVGGNFNEEETGLVGVDRRGAWWGWR